MQLRVLIASATFLAAAGISQAGLIYDGGAGATVYGATGYTCPGGNPCTAGDATGSGASFLGNNLTGDTDILTSPGNGYQVASPVINNNVAESPVGGVTLPGGFGGGVNAAGATPYVFAAAGGNGGNAPNAPFGTGVTANNGESVGFGLTDTTVGCCSASYMITSWTTDYTVDAAGLNGNLNAYLGITGVNGTYDDAGVASLVTSYSVNGGAYVPLTDMILAIGGACVNDVLAGDASNENNAACVNGGNGGAFSAAAVDTFNPGVLAAGTTLDFESTLTVYADPADFNSMSSIVDTSLLPELGLSASDIVVGDDAPAPAPEPGTLLLLGAGLVGFGVYRRKRA